MFLRVYNFVGKILEITVSLIYMRSTYRINVNYPLKTVLFINNTKTYFINIKTSFDNYRIFKPRISYY